MCLRLSLKRPVFQGATSLKPFTGSFTQQEALNDAAIAAAVEVLKSGRLHRYNSAPGELSKASELEQAYATYQGANYCLACASGGYAMAIALRAAGLEPGESVLTNAFTLAPVPGAIASAGGKPVLVEITADLVIDLDDLEQKAKQSAARFLLLSNMRGHLVDMDRLLEIVDRHKMMLIEDCAHTMGATWNGRKSGNFGLAGCFSTQTYKHMNSGEGGFLTTDDPDIAARATIMSGSYMLFARHGAGPDAGAFDAARYDMPNCSARMDALRAAILRPQLARLDQSIACWNARYSLVERALQAHDRIATIALPQQEEHAGSSIQFRLPGFSADQCRAVIAAAARRGVELKWFGAAEPVGFTSAHQSWRYVPAQDLPQTDRILATLFDMRLPLSFSEDDCALIADLIGEAVTEVAQ